MDKSNIHGEWWREFSERFPELVELFIKTDRTSRQLMALRSELAAVLAAPEMPLDEELAAMEREANAILDREEAWVAAGLAQDHPLAADFLERWRTNAFSPAHGGRIREAIATPAFAASVRALPQINRLHDLDLVRLVVQGFVRVQTERIAEGTLKDSHVPAVEREQRVEKLRKQIAALEEQLATESASSPPWRYLSGHDVIGAMVEEYVELLQLYPGGFVPEVLHRDVILGGKTRDAILYGQRGAEKYEMNDPARRNAAKKLREHVQGMTPTPAGASPVPVLR